MTDTGTSLIRKSLWVRNKKQNIAVIARDCGVSSSELHAFLDNQLKLQPITLGKLALYLLDDDYLPDVDKLKPRLKCEVVHPMAVLPTPLDGVTLTPFEPGPSQRAIRPVQPEKKVTTASRPGWAD